MIIGDTLICKKFILTSQLDDMFIDGNKYTIRDIFKNNIICILSDYKIINTPQLMLFNLYKSQNTSTYYIWDYFYMPDELRLKKLESL